MYILFIYTEPEFCKTGGFSLMLTDMYFELGGRKFHYMRGAENGPPLLLLHGLSDCWRTFLQLIPSLYPYYTIYAPDLRGHGQSDPAAGYGIMDYAADMGEFLACLGGEPVSIIGHSLGAAIALCLAAESPEKSKSITLIDPFVFEDIVHDDAFRSYFLGCLEVLTQDLDLAGISRCLKEKGALAKKRALDLFRLDKKTITAVLDKLVFSGFNLDELLPKVNCPVLLLRGNPEREGHITEEKAAYLQNGLKDCSVEYLDTASHVVHLDEPVKTAQFILFFLASL
jgi:pimeloyl-ACP methyl ester carboxylesterase